MHLTVHLQELKRELRVPDKQALVQHFQASEIADLPPRLRALFEDNKVTVQRRQLGIAALQVISSRSNTHHQAA